VPPSQVDAVTTATTTSVVPSSSTSNELDLNSIIVTIQSTQAVASSSSSSSSTASGAAISNDTPSSSGLPQAVASVVVAAENEGSSANSSEVNNDGLENIRFVESLPPDLRQEALLGATPDFLRTLTAAMQVEARRLQRERGFAGEDHDMLIPPFNPNPNRHDDVPINRSPEPKVLQPTTFSIAEDRSKDVLPYDRAVISRLFECVLQSPNNKLRGPRPLLKLLATACRYRAGRKWIMRAFVSLISGDESEYCYSLDRIPLENHMSNFGVGSISLTSTLLRRFLAGVSFIMRKTDKLVWNEILTRYEDSRGGKTWIFGLLLRLFTLPLTLTSVNMDAILHVIEEICTPFAKLSVAQANELAACQIGTGLGKGAVVEAAKGDDATAASEDISSTEDRGPATTKKRRLEASSEANGDADERTAMILDTSSSSSSSSLVLTAKETSTKASAKDENTKSFIFPTIDCHEAVIIASIAGNENCGGIIKKRLHRILRVLSLHDENWTTLLGQFSDIGAQLAAVVVMEITDVHKVLSDVVKDKGDPMKAMASPALSTSSKKAELKLLQVLRQTCG